MHKQKCQKIVHNTLPFAVLDDDDSPLGFLHLQFSNGERGKLEEQLWRERKRGKKVSNWVTEGEKWEKFGFNEDT